MPKEENNECCSSKNKNLNNSCNAGGGAVYGLGFIGALVYFLSHATSFWMGVLGILKAMVWPAMFVYYLFDFLKL